MQPEKRYNALRACLFFSLALLAFTSPILLANPIEGREQPATNGNSPSSPAPLGDTGNRYHICFTATDSTGGSTEKCLYITVVGSCTLSTADVNIDGRVDILDLAFVADHYGQSGAQAANPLNTPVVGLSDLTCVASFFNQQDPLP